MRYSRPQASACDSDTGAKDQKVGLSKAVAIIVAARCWTMCHRIEKCQPQPVVAAGRAASTASLLLLEIGSPVNHLWVS